MKEKSLLHKLGIIFPMKERLYFVGLFFLLMLGTVFDFLSISLILPLVNMLVNPALMENAIWFKILHKIIPIQDMNDMLFVLVLIIIGVYLIKNAYSIFMAITQSVFMARNQFNTSAKLLSCYIRKPYTFHLQHNTAEVVRNINTDVGAAYGLVGAIISLITSGLISILLIIYLVLIDPLLTCAIVLGIVIYSLVYYLCVRKPMREAGFENRRISVTMVKAIHQAVGGIKEVKVMGREQFFVDTFSENGKAYIKNRRKYMLLSGLPRHLIEVLCVTGVLGLVAYKIGTRQDLAAIVPSLSAFAVAAIKLMPSANSINSTINSMTYMMPSLDAVCEIIDENFNNPGAAAVEQAKQAVIESSAMGEDGDIELENVSFTYPNTDTPVLKNVNLKVRHGSSVGICGVTGAGKTTLVDIILGLLEPDTGTVRYDGVDIRKDYPAWQRHIGYVPQNIYLVDESIRSNVALGVYADQVDDEKVWQALEQAQLADFVRGLKDGLDTVIGERGVRISGGQRQRIGIARALYYDPDILFLDEATSSLDNETERAVMNSIEALSGRKTCIVIAHRLTTIEHCDDLYRVEDCNVFPTEL